MMQDSKGNLFTRDDTFFGVCEGLAEDLRIPGNFFRVAFALGFFFAPVPVIAAYLALGALVLVSRLLFPNPRAAKPAEMAAAEPAQAQVEREEQHELPIAA
jgi:phage shock protein PspC (stress-responsive transcriptional regulator)